MSKLKMKRFPGDTIVVPMLIGVVLNSFVPQVLQIGGFFTGMVNPGPGCGLPLRR